MASLEGLVSKRISTRTFFFFIGFLCNENSGFGFVLNSQGLKKHLLVCLRQKKQNKSLIPSVVLRCALALVEPVCESMMPGLWGDFKRH